MQQPRASATAPRQQAKFGKLRAAMRRGRECRARIDGGLAEGFDIPDRQEAKGLLDEVSWPCPSP